MIIEGKLYLTFPDFKTLAGFPIGVFLSTIQKDFPWLQPKHRIGTSLYFDQAQVAQIKTERRERKKAAEVAAAAAAKAATPPATTEAPPRSDVALLDEKITKLIQKVNMNGMLNARVNRVESDIAKLKAAYDERFRLLEEAVTAPPRPAQPNGEDHV